LSRGSTPQIHPWVADFETKVIRGEAAFRVFTQLRDSGFNPDVVIAHPGWGESLFVKQVWPGARLGIFCEFFYMTKGGDMGFDPEFPLEDPLAQACRLQLKNLNNELHFNLADGAIAPTKWQAQSFPEPFRSRIKVVFDGVDTDAVRPDPNVRLGLNRAGGAKKELTRDDEVITFVNRNLEPMRGYHVFMRALPEILRTRPNAHVIIVGGNGISYGAPPSVEKHGADNWKDVFINEIRSQVAREDWARVHFVGQVPYNKFIGILQLSRVHLYWTYPFVLSWSLIEAMSAGASIVASNTPPVSEVITDGEDGRLVDFFSTSGIVEAVNEVLDSGKLRQKFSEAARAKAIKNYDLNSVCLPAQIDWVNSLLDKRSSGV
jgi:glycosyltransferase involved in cell wall biosynthesis